MGTRKRCVMLRCVTVMRDYCMCVCLEAMMEQECLIEGDRL